MLHAHFVNLPDNVPFVRVYKTEKQLVSAYKRMKSAIFKDAIDFKNYRVIKLDELNRMMVE